jgi:hypothetical protein
VDAETKAHVINTALDQVVATYGHIEPAVLPLLSDVFSAGYAAGLSQGHADRDNDHADESETARRLLKIWDQQQKLDYVSTYEMPRWIGDDMAKLLRVIAARKGVAG